MVKSWQLITDLRWAPSFFFCILWAPSICISQWQWHLPCLSLAHAAFLPCINYQGAISATCPPPPSSKTPPPVKSPISKEPPYLGPFSKWEMHSHASSKLRIADRRTLRSALKVLSVAAHQFAIFLWVFYFMMGNWGGIKFNGSTKKMANQLVDLLKKPPQICNSNIVD